MRRILLALVLLSWQMLASAACPPLELALQPLGPDLWVRPARVGDTAGWTEPTLVWVGPHRVWIMDPGPHRCAGLALRQSLQQRWPGRAHSLINTHAHPRNVLANSAWPVGTPIHALPRVAREMARRCPGCLQALQEELGLPWMQGTRIVLPNRRLKPGQWLELGTQRWQVGERLSTHTEADLVLRQARQGLWLAPSLLSWEGVPDLLRADLRGWIGAVQALKAEGAGRTLPLGAQGGAAARLDFTLDYLQAMADVLSRAQDKGDALHDHLGWFDGLPDPAPDERGLRQHQLNVQKVWRWLEDQGLPQQR